jgi:hypothetical protein
MPSEEAEKAKDAGNEALKAKDYAGAVKHYTEAIKADPNSHTYYSNRSAAFASMNKPQDALADADKCINMEPTFARGYGRKGVALYKLGRYADAMVAYSSGLNKDAGNASLTQGLEAAKKAKELMETNLAGMGRSQPQYQQQGGPPATAEWRSAMPAGLGRVALNIAMLAFSVMYIAGAVQPANDAARYSYFSRAVMCALGECPAERALCSVGMVFRSDRGGCADTETRRLRRGHRHQVRTVPRQPDGRIQAGDPEPRRPELRPLDPEDDDDRPHRHLTPRCVPPRSLFPAAGRRARRGRCSHAHRPRLQA